ncbi:tetratricopeptide repeat protein [Pseudocitrobacter corydidari]|uniref:Secretory immunoglobulin A-binding protein EsiB n=1 Tax=Pseudocitrobacter corydidari TaxID=2891570 RepID=A0ABY3SD90_9ENTR|nr:tetratricopeptide repeat protein [Pseudocitrobacter corydidari]UGS43808.1 Secretory immunoglobulin A-binding protein EsiB [Pseudocitrobacter corydidari]
MRITIASIILIISATAIGAEDTPSHFDIPEQVLNNMTKESRTKLQDIITKAQHGDKVSQTVMGIIYLNGLTESPSVKDINKAFYWFNLAAKQDYDEAEFYLGQLYHYGYDNTTPNYRTAIYWYEKAAEKGNEQAQINCANIYQFGPQEFKNINKAKFWLQRAVQKDNPIAHANLGIIGVQENNYDEAIPHLKIAAEKGQRLGQYNYGTLFFNGHGVPKDIQQAKYWFEKAATQNLPIAQITLGQIYAWGLDGNGINKEEALLWLNKAKNQGSLTDKQIKAIISKKTD